MAAVAKANAATKRGGGLMSAESDRFYRHATGFTDGTKYIVRQSDGMILCVQGDKIVSAGRWLSVMDDWYVKNNRWIEITKEEASLL